MAENTQEAAEGTAADKQGEATKVAEQTEIEATKTEPVDVEAKIREAREAAAKEAKAQYARELAAEKKRIADESAKAAERAKMEEADRLKAEKADLEKSRAEAEQKAVAAERRVDLFRQMATVKAAPASDKAMPMIESAYGELVAGGMEPAEAMKALRKDYDFLFERVAPPAPKTQQAETGKVQSGTTSSATRSGAAPVIKHPGPNATPEELIAFVQRKRAAAG